MFVPFQDFGLGTESNLEDDDDANHPQSRRHRLHRLHPKSSEDGGGVDLRGRLDLPPGVDQLSCRTSAMSGSVVSEDADRGDSCGSFEFLGAEGKRAARG